MKRTFEDISADVRAWAEARKIIPNSNAASQAMKTLEEAGELLAAATAMGIYQEAGQRSQAIAAKNEVMDAIGDVMVTLVNAAALANLNPVECFEWAYQQIKDRKGTLLPNGIFQKEA